MHKEKYILAEMQIIEFENEDVITTSVGETTPEETDPTEPITQPIQAPDPDDDEVEVFVI